MKKRANACTIIGSADGPTSVFIVGKTKQRGIKRIKQEIFQRRYQKKRKKVMTGITANSHTIDQVIQYITSKYGATLVPEDSQRFISQRKSFKAAFVQKYYPEVLGEDCMIEPPNIEDEKSIREFMEKIDTRQEKAALVSEDIVPMDYHIYHIKCGDYGEIWLEIEKIRELMSTTSSGKLERVNEVVKDIFRYYGVSKEDIEKQTERYQYLVLILMEDCRRRYKV